MLLTVGLMVYICPKNDQPEEVEIGARAFSFSKYKLISKRHNQQLPLFQAKQIRKKTWPYRIESIFLSLLGEPTMSYCRSCCFRNDNRSFHKNIKVGNVLSESCFLFTWAMDDEIKSPV